MIFEESPEETPGTQRAVAEAGVAPLTGSDDEITRAAPLRTAVLVEADSLLTQMRSNETLTESARDTAVAPGAVVTHAQVLQAQAALNRLRHQTEAGWWIANGGRGAAVLLDEMHQPSTESA